MTHESFEYKVYANIKLSRAELNVLLKLAKMHYSWECKAAAEPGPDAFLNGIKMTFWKAEKNAPHAGTGRLDSRDLGIAMKILEGRQYGLKPKERTIADALSDSLRDTFHALQKEWSELDSRPFGTPEMVAKVAAERRESAKKMAAFLSGQLP